MISDYVGFQRYMLLEFYIFVIWQGVLERATFYAHYSVSNILRSRRFQYSCFKQPAFVRSL
jgi:hypothetical protein